MFNTPQSEEFYHARHVTVSPEAFANQPAVLGWAWETLKAARGQIVDHDTMGPPAHRVVPNPAYDPATKIRRRVQEHAARSGLATTPAPLIAQATPERTT
ncbi:MAG: hypothetical protein ABJL67_01915 [Sulfitobacter sp.]